MTLSVSSEMREAGSRCNIGSIVRKGILNVNIEVAMRRLCVRPQNVGRADEWKARLERIQGRGEVEVSQQ